MRLDITEIEAFFKSTNSRSTDAKYLGVQEGYEVYAPNFDGHPNIGLPKGVLVRDGVMRWSTDKEAMPLIKAFPSKDESG